MAVVAESLFMKQQLLIVNRSRRCAPNLSVLDRFHFGFRSQFSIHVSFCGQQYLSDLQRF
jgi:hypothetical protein